MRIHLKKYYTQYHVSAYRFVIVERLYPPSLDTLPRRRQSSSGWRNWLAYETFNLEVAPRTGVLSYLVVASSSHRVKGDNLLSSPLSIYFLAIILTTRRAAYGDA
jgi:hypothetical protein